MSLVLHRALRTEAGPVVLFQIGNLVHLLVFLKYIYSFDVNSNNLMH